MNEECATGLCDGSLCIQCSASADCTLTNAVNQPLSTVTGTCASDNSGVCTYSTVACTDSDVTTTCAVGQTCSSLTCANVECTDSS